MNRLTAGLSIAAAFAAGCGATHLLRPALAAENITAQIIHTGEMEGDALGPANKVGYRSKMFASADGATISIQVRQRAQANASQHQRDPSWTAPARSGSATRR
nr:hypothetical protein [Bradyrhizobium diazoefficiens]